MELWRGSLWSPSYFAVSCGGAPKVIIKQFIEHSAFQIKTIKTRVSF